MIKTDGWLQWICYRLTQVVVWMCRKTSVLLLCDVALVRSKGQLWASLSMNQQPASVPHAVLLHRNLDLQHVTYPSNKIIPALNNHSWHFLCGGRDGMLLFHLATFCVTRSAFYCVLYGGQYFQFFLATQHSEARHLLWTSPSVCPSVCLLHSWVTPKWF